MEGLQGAMKAKCHWCENDKTYNYLVSLLVSQWLVSLFTCLFIDRTYWLLITVTIKILYIIFYLLSNLILLYRHFFKNLKYLPA